MKPMRNKYNSKSNTTPEPDALRALGSVVIPPPARERMLASAYEQAELMLQDEEERKMHPFYNLFSGKRWHTRLAVGLAIALVMLACLTVTLVPRPQGGGYSLEPAQPAIASQPGYLLAAFSDAEDEVAAKAEAEQLQKLAQELLTLKQGEMERLQQMLAELETELEAKQELIARELDGQELTADEQAKLEYLEQELQLKAEQLLKDSDRLLGLAGLLSAKEQFVRRQADVLKLNLEELELPDNVKIATKVEQLEDGKFQIYLTLPNMPEEIAEEIKLKLDELPGLDSVEVDGVSIVTGVDSKDAPKLLRELKEQPGKVIRHKVVVVKGEPGMAGEAKVDVKEVDGQIIVRVEGEAGEPLVLDGKSLAQGGAFTVEALPEFKEFKEIELDELDKLYKVIVSADDAMEAFTITMSGDGADGVVKLMDGKSGTVDELLDLPGAKLYKGELLDGLGEMEREKKLQELGFLELAPTPEKLAELKKQGYITQHDVQVITEELGDGQKKLQIIAEGGLDGESLDIEKLLELDPQLQKMAQVEAMGMGDGMVWTAPGGNSLSIMLDGGGADGEAFGWLNDDSIGSFVLIGGDGDELRAVEVGEARAYVGDPEAYERHLNRVRAYLREHYAGQGAGFKATGKDGKLAVKVLLDGKVAEELTVEAGPDGSPVITNQG